jgi:hypothetical protein
MLAILPVAIEIAFTVMLIVYTITVSFQADDLPFNSPHIQGSKSLSGQYPIVCVLLVSCKFFKFDSVIWHTRNSLLKNSCITFSILEGPHV